MIGENRSFTIATANDQSLFIFSHTQGLDPQPSKDVSPTLRANGGGMAVAYDEFNDSVADTHHTLRSGTKQSTGVVIGTLQARDYKGLNHEGARDGKAIVEGAQVRRLTPLECERLQGFPDGWTEGQSDSNRYKQMGNAVAVPVVEWIIGNITAIV
jgi:DNA (cytosine-5)-methyltransferase 1